MDLQDLLIYMIFLLAAIGSISLVSLAVYLWFNWSSKPPQLGARWVAHSNSIYLDELLTITVGTWLLVRLIEWIIDPRTRYLINLALAALRDVGFPV